MLVPVYNLCGSFSPICALCKKIQHGLINDMKPYILTFQVLLFELVLTYMNMAQMRSGSNRYNLKQNEAYSACVESTRNSNLISA